MNILQLRPGKIEPGFLPGSDGKKDRIEAAGQFVQGKVESDPAVEVHLHADALDQIQLAPQDRFGQPVLGNGEAQHPARLAALFKDRDFVAQHGQVEGGRQAGGAGAGHGYPCGLSAPVCVPESA